MMALTLQAAIDDAFAVIVVAGGKIISIDELRLAKPNDLRMIPGVIGLHIHSRQPGGNQKEDWDHLWRAAVKGGVTTIVTMPNTNPPIVDFPTLALARLCAKHSQIQPKFWFGGVPRSIPLFEQALQQPDVVGIKMFVGSSTGDLLVEREEDQWLIMQECTRLGAILAVHAEDEAIIKGNLVALGREPFVAEHGQVHSAEAECSAVRRTLRLAQETGCRVYFCHISTVESAQLVIQPKRQGLPVYVEVTPHHLFLHDGCLNSSYPGRYKMNPPLRSSADAEGLTELLVADQVDHVDSDHAPHTLAEKSTPDYKNVPSGVPGIETVLPLMIDLVTQGRLTWQQLQRYTSGNAAELMGWTNKGRVAVGADADLVIIDPTVTFPIDNIWGTGLATKCGWTPFAGRVVQGAVVETYSGGKLLFRRGEYFNSL